jgi:hypothetical protein
MRRGAPDLARLLRSALIWSLGALAILAAAVTGLLAAPQPLYPYHLEHAGLELWSDQPVDQTAGHRFMADVEGRLAQSILGGVGGNRRIFIAGTAWRERLFFLWNHGAAGVNYYPFTRNAFLRRSDVAADRLFGPAGRPAEPPRTLAYYAAHELAHGLTGERAGTVAFIRMPRWLREGLADYAALGAGRAKEMAGSLAPDDPRLSPERSGHYLRFHLLVACAHEDAGLSLQQLLALRLTEAEAASRWLEAEAPGRSARACRDGAATRLSPQSSIAHANARKETF